ncbi:MAG: ABC transporter substrate-binding protein [Synergistaceae bacterium]|jgi:ABC-type nitrate/sulfonate/bicarbonate transport system substrate-binding protein|nr:ABC transporter substrate-binding protein [Synergistaceae bacterium]
MKKTAMAVFGKTMTKGRLFFSGVLVIFAVLTAGFLSALPAAASEVVEFRYPEWVYYDLIYLADDLGYFRDAGVKPKYVGQIAAGQMIPALTTGDLDVANRHTPLVIAAVASGADIKIFAAGSKSTQKDPHMKYFVRADSPIRSIEDFGGKTLGINSFGACSEFVTKKYAQDNGIDPTSIRMITAPDSEQEVPLLRGDTDVAIIHPLSSGRASANTKDFRLLFSDWDIDGGISGMCPYSVSGEFLKKHPDAVKELTAILSRAAQWNNTHREEARQLMAKRFGFKLEEAEMFEFYEDQKIPLRNIEYWIDRLEAEKKIAAGEIKASQVYTNDYNPAN